MRTRMSYIMHAWVFRACVHQFDMLTLLTLIAFSLSRGVGRVLLLHSFQSRATSCVTPTPARSSFICWCHVFLGRPRRLVPGIASSITLRVTVFASRLWTCPNQWRRPLWITSSIREMCNMRQISSFRMWSRLDTTRIPRTILISVVAIVLSLVTFIAQHSLPYVRAGLSMASYTFDVSLRGIFRSYNTVLQSIFSSLTMQPAREGPRLYRWCHLYLSPIPGTSNGQHSSVLLHSVWLAAGFPLLTDVLFLPHWSSDHCLLRPSATTPVCFGYLYL